MSDQMILRRIRKVLFDLDGTLFDTQELHAQVESRLLSEHGFEITPRELTLRFSGTSTKKIFQTLLGCSESDSRTMCEEKWRILFTRTEESRPLGDLQYVFDTLLLQGIGIAIGTASPKAWARTILVHHALLHYFDEASIIGGDMVDNGKPAPDIWLLASGGIDSGHCFVVEDGFAGVEAGLAAGMTVGLLLPNRHERAIPLECLADVVTLLT